LNRLDAIRFGNPTTDRAPLHKIDLTGLPPPEQVAVLQSALYDAGYSFKNLVPAFEQRQGWTRHVVPEQLQNQISSIIRAAKDVEDRFKEIQRVVKRETSAEPANPKSSGEGMVSIKTSKVPRPSIDPSKYRSPVSIPSTSDWESDDSSSDKEAPRGEEAATTGLEGETFLRPTSLGPNLASVTSSRRPAGPSLAVRSMHQPPPSEFDEPMELAPAFQSQGVAGSKYQAPTTAQVFAVPSTSFGRNVQSGAAPATFQAGAPVTTLPATGYVAPQARPFIPYRYVDEFYGNEPLDDRRKWWEEFQYAASAGMWTDQEKCRHLRMYLKKPAFS
jgi:hypothetical protein